MSAKETHAWIAEAADVYLLRPARYYGPEAGPCQMLARRIECPRRSALSARAGLSPARTWWSMDTQTVQSDPGVMMGKPVVSETRITVELIMEKLGAGESMEQVLSTHPRLTEVGNRAALARQAP